MSNILTPFEVELHHIYLELALQDISGVLRSARAILDTGAPRSEFSDQFLQYAGLISSTNEAISLKPGLQTQKYAKVIIPHLEICGTTLQNFEVLVAKFEDSWGIDALIGLDFFRRFRTTIDYSKAQIEIEPLLDWEEV